MDIKSICLLFFPIHLYLPFFVCDHNISVRCNCRIPNHDELLLVLVRQNHLKKSEIILYNDTLIIHFLLCVYVNFVEKNIALVIATVNDSSTFDHLHADYVVDLVGELH